MSDANVWSYVIGAYAVTWLGLIGYGIRLAVLYRQARGTTGRSGGGP